jgi:tetratricopeptide (TPR) repeat protein
MENTPLSPETILYDNGKGRTVTLADLNKDEGTPHLSAWNVSEQAFAFHAEGRKYGAEGNYELALAALSKAAEMAPEWPYPVYDAAFTYLLQHNWPEALAHYRFTHRLYPDGFFTTLTAIDTLEREESGELPVGLYLLYIQLEWTEDAADRQKIIDLLTTRCPEYAPGWKAKSLQESQTRAQRLESVEKGLKALPDLETLGLLQVNKAILIAQDGHIQEAMAILGELLLDGRTTQANRMMGRMAMKSILGILESEN